MRLAIMQPYLFPYPGYFNLVSLVDKFVFYDDVNFIKNGWINRNRLFISDDVRYFTVPLRAASSYAKICDVRIQPKEIWLRKILESVKQAYSKAPNFEATFALFNDVLSTECDDIASLAKASITRTAERLGLTTVFVESSEIYGNSNLHGVDRVLDICRIEKVTDYINLPGGRELYDHDKFLTSGLMLHFSVPVGMSYSRAGQQFVPGLSIIDMMMFNSFDKCRSLILESNNVE